MELIVGMVVRINTTLFGLAGWLTEALLHALSHLAELQLTRITVWRTLKVKDISVCIKINHISAQNCSVQCTIKLLYVCIHHIWEGMCSVSLVVINVQFLIYSDSLLKDACLCT